MFLSMGNKTRSYKRNPMTDVCLCGIIRTEKKIWVWKMLRILKFLIYFF